MFRIRKHYPVPKQFHRDSNDMVVKPTRVRAIWNLGPSGGILNLSRRAKNLGLASIAVKCTSGIWRRQYFCQHAAAQTDHRDPRGAWPEHQEPRHGSGISQNGLVKIRFVHNTLCAEKSKRSVISRFPSWAKGFPVNVGGGASISPSNLSTSSFMFSVSSSEASAATKRSCQSQADLGAPIPDDPSEWMHIVMFPSPEVHKSATLP